MTAGKVQKMSGKYNLKKNSPNFRAEMYVNLYTTSYKMFIKCYYCWNYHFIFDLETLFSNNHLF